MVLLSFLFVCVLFRLLFFSVTSFIGSNTTNHVSVEDSEDQEQPVGVQKLQSKDQGENNWLRDPALVLLSVPVQSVVTNGLKLSQNRPKNTQVDPVSEVDPHKDKEDEERTGKNRVQVVQGLRCSQKEIRDIHGNINFHTHPSEVESIGKPNKSDGDDVMQNKLVVVLSWSLQLQNENHRLLNPKGGLTKVVDLKVPVVSLVRVLQVERGSLKEPQRSSGHNPHTKRTSQTVVEHSVSLLQETVDLSGSLQATNTSQRLQDSAHDKLSQETKEQSVEANKVKVIHTLAILVSAWDVIGWSDGLIQSNVDWVGLTGEEVGGIKDNQSDEWVDPCLAESELFEADLDFAQQITSSVIRTLQHLTSLIGVLLLRWSHRHRRKARNRSVTNFKLSHRGASTAMCDFIWGIRTQQRHL